jgi:signal recognition particle receptor subunit beta
MATPAQIFLSYAREDAKQVKELYYRLLAAGFKPWMDTEDLLPGELWAPSIQRALQRADFFFACLSGISVSKRSYIRQELSDALKKRQQMLESDIYLIPIRLEVCEVPEDLKEHQYVDLVDLFRNDGWSRLVKAIEEGMKRRSGTTSEADTAAVGDVPSHARPEQPPEELVPYIDYTQVCLTLTRDLTQLQVFAERLHLQTSSELIQGALTRLGKGTFTIAVIGGFKAGKTTLINALIGKAILPTEVLPTTATLSRLTYGPMPLLKVRFKNGREQDYDISRLAEYVTIPNPATETTTASVQETVVVYPAPFCLHNVDVIDTPGLGNVEHLTQVALSALPLADLVIMVLPALAPFSAVDQLFLERYLSWRDIGSIIFVINRIDALSTPQAERVVAGVRERIDRYIQQRAMRQADAFTRDNTRYAEQVEDIHVFGLSAYLALHAKQTHDVDLLARSCFPSFETTLEKLLVQDRGSVGLLVAVNQTIASASDILRAIHLQGISGTLLDPERQLAQLHFQRGPEGMLSGGGQEGLQAMRGETERIRDRATALSKQLVQSLRI